MNTIKFIFPFLYARNWHNGELELSRPRLVLFSAALFLVLLGLVIVSILQAPVTYELV